MPLLSPKMRRLYSDSLASAGFALMPLSEKERQWRIELKHGTGSTAYRESSQFARIWTLAAAFGLLSVIPLVMLSEKYPWAVLAVVILGSICTTMIDVLSTRNDQKGRYLVPNAAIQRPKPVDLSHRKTIDVSMFYECEYWSKQFNISEDELREAVSTAGPNIANLKAYLEYKKSKGPVPPSSTSPTETS